MRVFTSESATGIRHNKVKFQIGDIVYKKTDARFYSEAQPHFITAIIIKESGIAYILDKRDITYYGFELSAIPQIKQDLPTIKTHINYSGITDLQMSYDEITELKTDLEECNLRILEKGIKDENCKPVHLYATYNAIIQKLKNILKNNDKENEIL